MLAVSSVLRTKTITLCHNDSKPVISSSYWWPGIGEIMCQYVSFSIHCQLHKHTTSRRVGKIQLVRPPEYPFERLSIYRIGPF